MELVDLQWFGEAKGLPVRGVEATSQKVPWVDARGSSIRAA
jgi:hypothetical protein